MHYYLLRIFLQKQHNSQLEQRNIYSLMINYTKIAFSCADWSESLK